jgi:hypothetical protein
MAKKRSTGAGYLQRMKAIGMGRLLFVALFAVVGGYYAYILAASGVNRIDNPAKALRFTPSDSTALAAQADLLYFANPEKPPKKAYDMALAALRQQTANPKAVRLLGVQNCWSTKLQNYHAGKRDRNSGWSKPMRKRAITKPRSNIMIFC